MTHDKTDVAPKKRILIVEDSEDMRTLLDQILEDEGIYTVQFAENGQQALQKAVDFQPELILMDMSLPIISGWEVVPQLRLLPQFAQTPIIAITAHVSQADQDRALALGCNAYLGKPFDITMVVDIIVRVLDNTSSTAI